MGICAMRSSVVTRLINDSSLVSSRIIVNIITIWSLFHL